MEIVDLRSLNPLDVDVIANSVKKTGRAVVVHEAPRNYGVGAEVVAQINENCFLNLEAPVERVCGWDVNIPLPKLEKYYFPDAERVTNAVEKVMAGLDHEFLNELAVFKNLNPSSENIARIIYEQVGPVINSDRVRITKVTAWESDTACATYSES